MNKSIEEEKISCKTMGILGFILSFIISILSLPFSIIAINKGKKIKKETDKIENGYYLGIAGVIISIFTFLIYVFLFIVSYRIYNNLIKPLTYKVNNNTIVKVLQNNNIISNNLTLIDTEHEVYARSIPHRYKYYIYQDGSDNILAIYYKTNTITKDDFTIKIYNNLTIEENIEYIEDDIGEYETRYFYKDGRVSDEDKYNIGMSDCKTYFITRTGSRYKVKEKR